MEIDEFIRNIDAMRLRFPSDAAESLEKGAKKMTKAIRKASPVGKYEHPHKLKKSWKCKMKGWTSDTIHAEIQSNAPHFHLVNRGFQRVDHAGRIVPNRGRDLAHVGFLQQAVESHWDEVRKDMQQDFFEKVRDRLG